MMEERNNQLPQLPAEVQDKIFQEAQDMLAFKPDNKTSYIKGAAAYAMEGHQLKQVNEKVVDYLRRLRNITTWLDMPNGYADLLNGIDNYLKDCNQHLTDKAQPGPVWVKASTRVPSSWHLKCTRFIHTKQPLIDAERWLNDHPEAIAVVEWLDESGTAANELQELRRWKMEAVEQLMPIGAYCHKHLEVNIGDSCMDLVLAELDRLKQESEYLKFVIERIYKKAQSTTPTDIGQKIKAGPICGEIQDLAEAALRESGAIAEYNAYFKDKSEKLAVELRRCLNTMIVHPDYQPNSEFRDRIDSANDALNEWSGEKEVDPAPPVLDPRKIVFQNNSDAFRHWAMDIKGLTIVLLGHCTGVVLPDGVTESMFKEEWEAYEKEHNPAKKNSKTIEIIPGLKFRNSHLPQHSFEVINVAPGNNTLSVRITSPSGEDRWTEPDWNLQHTKWGFERGEYYIEKEVNHG